MRLLRITKSDGSTVTAMTVEDAKRNPAGYGVYQLLDAQGDLLYTGRTIDLPNRLQSHASQKPFWPSVAYVAWTPCADYAESVALERMAISTSPVEANITGWVDLDEKAKRGRMELPAPAARRLLALYAVADDPAMSAHCDSYMLALKDAGWTLQAIAAPLNITRERVRQRIAEAARDLDLIVPAPPAKPWRRPVRRYHLWPAEQREAVALYEIARTVNGGTAEDDPARAASQRLSELFAELICRGVTAPAIAEAVGCSVVTVNMRLARHGYRKTPPSVAAYAGSKTQPKTTLRGVAECFRGHDLTKPGALRFINGDETRPICRECERVRVAKYRANKRAGRAAA